MRTTRAATLAALLIAGVAPAHATCTTHMPTTATVASATALAGLANSSITLGTPTALQLVPVATVHFPARPDKTDGPYAGMFSFDVPQASAFRISLGGRAWIDVVEGQATIASTTHQHGAACSGIAKEVTFPLTAGRHVIEITASAAPGVAIRVEPTD